MNTSTTTASEFISSISHPIILVVGNGCPGGERIAYFEDTSLPFDLNDVEGEVEGGTFTATNLKDGAGIYDWRFHDHSGNIIYNIEIYHDRDLWEREVIDYATQEGINAESRSYCLDMDIDEETFDSITGYVSDEVSEFGEWSN